MAKLNPQRLTLAIVEKVLEFEDLTQNEADLIYPSGAKQKVDVGAFGCEEFEDDDNESGEWLCTGRIAPKKPIRIE